MMNETKVTGNPLSVHSAKKEVISNREFKSTVFSLLYDDRKKLLSLYNAMNHSRHSNPDELIIVTLTNALYIG